MGSRALAMTLTPGETADWPRLVGWRSGAPAAARSTRLGRRSATARFGLVPSVADQGDGAKIDSFTYVAVITGRGRTQPHPRPSPTPWPSLIPRPPRTQPSLRSFEPNVHRLRHRRGRRRSRPALCRGRRHPGAPVRSAIERARRYCGARPWTTDNAAIRGRPWGLEPRTCGLQSLGAEGACQRLSHPPRSVARSVLAIVTRSAGACWIDVRFPQNVASPQHRDALVVSGTMRVRRDVGRRLIITGSSGSGKSVLGLRLSVLLDVQHTDLDLIVIDNTGQRKPSGTTSAGLETAALSEGWILEGAPWDVPERAWSTASTVLFLDLPRIRRAWWLFKREFPRRPLRTRMWGAIRHALTAPHMEGERWRHYARDKTPATVPFIEISSVKEIRDLIRDVGDSVGRDVFPRY